MINLAEINENNICIGVKTVISMIDDGRHIEISTPDFMYYEGRKYDNGAWSEEKFLPNYAQLEKDRVIALEQEIALLWYELMMLGGN